MFTFTFCTSISATLFRYFFPSFAVYVTYPFGQQFRPMKTILSCFGFVSYVTIVPYEEVLDYFGCGCVCVGNWGAYNHNFY